MTIPVYTLFLFFGCHTDILARKEYSEVAHNVEQETKTKTPYFSYNLWYFGFCNRKALKVPREWPWQAEVMSLYPVTFRFSFHKENPFGRYNGLSWYLTQTNQQIYISSSWAEDIRSQLTIHYDHNISCNNKKHTTSWALTRSSGSHVNQHSSDLEEWPPYV